MVQTCFMAALVAEEHECREIFTYQGEAIFGPHFDLDELVSFAKERKTSRRAELEDIATCRAVS